MIDRAENEHKGVPTRLLDRVRTEWDDHAYSFDEDADHGLQNPDVKEAWMELLMKVIGTNP